jgi:hypothetical protein
VEKIFHANRPPKQSGIIILTFDKTDFRIKLEEIMKVTSY